MKALTAENCPFPPAVLPPEPDPKTICNICGEVKARSQFGWDRGGRHRGYCRDCGRKKLIQNALAEYDQKKRDELQQFVGAVNDRSTIAHVTQLANTMAAHTGGLEGFCAFWWGTITKAAEEKKYKPVLDGCNAIKNLFVEASKHEQRDKEVQHLSRAEMLTETLDFILWCAEYGDTEERALAQTTIKTLQGYGLEQSPECEPVAP